MPETPKTWTVAEALRAQRKLCDEKGLPHFAPTNGVCWSCRQQIFAPPNGNDGQSFVTGCPFCHKTYCD